MMKKVLGILKKYKLSVIIAGVVLVIGIIGLVSLITNTSMKKITNKNYSLAYDGTWNITSHKSNKIVLKHRSGSKIYIQITTLKDEYKYATIDEMMDDLLYSISNQNKNYKLLTNNKDKITKYKYDGYKLLYENGKKQVMIYLYKKGDKLITIRFEAKNDYFDMLLDSVNNIANSLNVKDSTFNLKSKIELKTVKLSFEEDNKLDKAYKDSKEYEIAKDNYLVKYKIPSNFIRTNLDSTLGLFTYKYDDKTISLNVDIYSRNIYEYLDKDANSSVYSSYKYYHNKDSKDYSNFKESLSKLDGKGIRYIYKNSYDYNILFGQGEKRHDETAELIYSLDNNHTLVIKIQGSGAPITKKLIDAIDIGETKNYASYIKLEKEDNMLIGKLQRFKDYNKDKLEVVNFKVPDKYEEVDKNANIYLKRYYRYGYEDDMDIYDYEVSYEFTELESDKFVDIINSSYIKTTHGEANNLAYVGELTSNGKVFKVYSGGYTDISGIMFTSVNRVKYYVNMKVLFYELPNGGLSIRIDGNNKEITKDVIDELTQFTIEEENF